MIKTVQYQSFDGTDYVTLDAFQIGHPQLGTFYVKADDEGKHFCDLTVRELVSYATSNLEDFNLVQPMVKYGRSLVEVGLYSYFGAIPIGADRGGRFDALYTSEFDRRNPQYLSDDDYFIFDERWHRL